MKVVALKPARPCDDVVGGLRRLADEIEAGFDWPVSTAVVLLGHVGAEGRPDDEGWVKQAYSWETRGYGPRTDLFTVRGLMATCLREWDSEQ